MLVTTGQCKRKLKNLLRCLVNARWRVIFVSYLVTFLLVLPVVCRTLRHTPLQLLYSRNETTEKEQLLAQNTDRYTAALATLAKFSNLENHSPMRHVLTIAGSSSNPVDTNVTSHRGVTSHPLKGGLAITIITVTRKTYVSDQLYNPHYLIQTVAKFLEVLNNSRLATNKIPIHFSVCNVDQHPTKHADVNDLPKWLPQYSPSRIVSRESMPGTSAYDRLLEKEKRDYVTCLDHLLVQNMSYLMLVEDDAVPRGNLLPVLEMLMVSHRRVGLSMNSDTFNNFQDATFVKLYHPERLMGFISFEKERFSELFAIAILLTCIVIAIDITWFKRKAEDHCCSTFSYSQIFSIFIYFILLTLSIGRHSFCELRRTSNNLYYTTPAPSCCTPAMLFPRSGAIAVSNHLKTVTCKKGQGKDTSLDRFIKTNGLYTKLIQPNLFQHIGHFSSLRRDFISPFSV